MLQIQTQSALQNWLDQRTGTWAFVPTMGNLHRGHLALVEHAKTLAEHVAVSVYVNPTQFGVGEDFERYPRTLAQDAELLTQVGADVLFAPTVEMIYPLGLDNALSYQLPTHYTQMLCGLTRPTHFQGVVNVVSRLFQLMRPQVAIFGEKDYQQQWIIKRFVADFQLPIQIISHPIEREADGLALSSRNQYLSSEERALAPVLYQSLHAVQKAVRQGASAQTAIDTGKALCHAAGIALEYLDIRTQSALQNVAPNFPVSEPAVALIAAKIGQTRLIDNLVLS